MSQFMGKHGFDFILGQGLEQGVVKYNTLVFTKTGEIGITVRRSFSSVDDKHTLAIKPTALQEIIDPGF